MNQAATQTKYKLAKGQFVNIVSTRDVRIRLEEDLHITSHQITNLRFGEVLVKQTGFQFIAHRDQLNLERKPVAQPEESCYSTWRLDENEKIDSCSSSDGRDAYEVVSYAHGGRPSGNGRVVRSLKI